MKKADSSFFQNAQCEYFPCHDVADTDEFNCMFCYCPLYTFEDCGGDFTYTKKGVKNCEDCTLPHFEHGFLYVRSRLNKATEP